LATSIISSNRTQTWTKSKENVYESFKKVLK